MTSPMPLGPGRDFVEDGGGGRARGDEKRLCVFIVAGTRRGDCSGLEGRDPTLHS